MYIYVYIYIYIYHNDTAFYLFAFSSSRLYLLSSYLFVPCTRLLITIHLQPLQHGSHNRSHSLAARSFGFNGGLQLHIKDMVTVTVKVTVTVLRL